ncbi:MAG: P1 family peptidase [Synergistaceae bacterium]|nr:P1 family peptidase [Synergistaceae bacterium]
MREISIFDIEGVLVGHSQNVPAARGCSVLICASGARAGVDVRGGAPATRETDLLNPVNMIERIHAVLLSGGSAFGLNAASGVMRFLEEHGIGFDVTAAGARGVVPIVCGASLFDLAVGDPAVRPDDAMGYEACANAWSSSKTRNLQQGNVGAGTGASVGKFYGMGRAMKCGFGVYGLQAGGLKVASIVAVNALGDVVDPDTGKALAGLLDDQREKIINTELVMCDCECVPDGKKEPTCGAGCNTTIGVVVTNGKMTKAQAAKVASMAHNGFARSLRPAHTMFDGDTIFALSVGDIEADVNVIGVLAVKTMERAIRSAALHSENAYGLRGYLS